jgi:elongation factor G
MKRYKVPRLAFVNKCDRVGANPVRVRDQLREKLGHNAVLLQLPIGLEDGHQGVVDLVDMKAYTFHGENGEEIKVGEIPAELQADAEAYREELLDSVSMFSDELMEAMLEENVTEELIHKAIREGTLSLDLTPVLLGSAYKNKGVQKLLDAVIEYLPTPMDITNEAIDLNDETEATKIEMISDPEKQPCALAFKLEDGRYGQLTYLRVYQGTLVKDDFIINTRTKKKHKIPRLVRMHSNEMEDVTEAGAGDIVAIFGLDCHSGDTFTDGKLKVAMTSMHVPELVISVAIKPKDSKAEQNLSKALNRFTKEDPTFRAYVDQESGETVIQGMGELHLEVYIERMRREYNVDVETSPPRVAYRETITKRADYNYTHKKQTGGSGQFGKILGYVEPCEEEDFEFIDEIVGGAVPRQFIPSVQKGFKSMMQKGMRLGYPVVNVRCVLNDGAYHAVDSSDMAFQATAKGAWREIYNKAKPRVLEPIMKVVVEGPSEHAGNVLTTLMQRRGMIIGSQEEDKMSQTEAEVPLAEMFGYSTALRSATQGKAEFTMEFSRYMIVPEAIETELIEKAKAAEEASK